MSIISVVRFADSFDTPRSIPALKCWAIIGRPASRDLFGLQEGSVMLPLLFLFRQKLNEAWILSEVI